jgi:hypothetical protein
MRGEHHTASARAREPLARSVLRHGPLASLLAVGGLWTAWLLGMLWPTSGAEPVLARLRESRTRAQRAVGEARFPEGKTWSARLDASATAAVRAWRMPPRPDPPRPAASLLAPEAWREHRAEGLPNELTFPGPRDLQAHVSFGRVDLVWVTGDAGAGIVEADRWVIERRDLDAPGAPVERYELPALPTTWQDEEVRPGRRYLYRVRGVTEDADFLRAGGPATSPVAEASGRLPDVLDVELLGGTPEGGARLRVTRLDVTPPVSHAFAVALQGRVGERLPGGPDLATSWRLVDVETSTASEEETRQVPLFDEEGKVLRDAEGAVRTRTITRRVVYDVARVRLEDAAGRSRELESRRKR